MSRLSHTCLHISLLLISTLLISTAFAQTLSIGVILSTDGAASASGIAHEQAVRVLQTQLRAQQGVFGTPTRLIIKNDSSSPEQALVLARELVEQEGVQALVCCSSVAATRAIRSYVSSQQVLTLALSELPDEESYWLFSVKPDLRRQLQSVILKMAARAETSVGLMTLDNSFGDNVRRTLDLLLPPGSLYLAVDQRYRPDATVLTPEALWVASRQPARVFLWGLRSDTSVAYQALRDRGYEGEVVLNADLLNPSMPALDYTRLSGASFVVSPVQVASSLPVTSTQYTPANQFVQAMRAAYGPNRVLPEGAYAYDAVQLLIAAFEQALGYGVTPDNTSTFRQAVRDGLVGLPEFTGATGTYDFTENDHIGVKARSLIIATIRQNKLEFAE